MVQRYPLATSPSRRSGLLSKPVENAVKLMYMGAAISTVSLIISLVFIGSIKTYAQDRIPEIHG